MTRTHDDILSTVISVKSGRVAGEYDLGKVLAGPFGEGNVIALVTRGIRAFVGNEGASKVASWAEKEKVDTKDPANAQLVQEAYDRFKAAALETLYNGEIGAGREGESLSPLETEMRSLAKTDVVSVMLKGIFGAKWTPPKKHDVKIDLKNGQILTIDEMTDIRLEKYSTSLDKWNRGNYEAKATKALEAKAKAKAKAAEASAQMAAAGATVEDLF